MAIVNVTPRRPSIVGVVIGVILTIVGAYLLWDNRQTVLEFIFIFAGFFLVLFGLGVLTASIARRG